MFVMLTLQLYVTFVSKEDKSRYNWSDPTSAINSTDKRGDPIYAKDPLVNLLYDGL